MRSICCRKSGPQSNNKRVSSVSTKAEQRKRLSRGSSLLHTRQLQPIWGTPVLVPVPKKVSFMIYAFLFDINQSVFTDKVHFRMNGDAKPFVYVSAYRF